MLLGGYMKTTDNIYSISPQDITKPDILFKIELIKQIAYIRAISISTPQLYPRAVQMLSLLLSPYHDSLFKQDVKSIDNEADVIKIKKEIAASRDEKEIRVLEKKLEQLKADYLFIALLKLMNRNSLLLEGKAILDFGLYDDSVDDEIEVSEDDIESNKGSGVGSSEESDKENSREANEEK